MHKSPLILFLALTFILGSCFKKEDVVVLPSGNTTITTVSLGNEYENEVYFDLGTNTYSVSNRKNWDLRFETSDTGWGIFINTGSNLRLKKLNLHDLVEPASVDTMNIMKLDTLLDDPDGRAVHSAFKDWRSYKTTKNNKVYNGIYVLELPYRSGSKRFIRVQVDSVTTEAYYCYFTELFDASGNQIKENNNRMTIPKSKNFNYTYLSFDNGPRVVAGQEPDKSSWDIVFTRYNQFFENILPNNKLFPYNVNGILSSSNNVIVAKDSVTPYQNIDKNRIPGYRFSSDANAIGYDWKSHAFGAVGSYTVNSKITYIIRDTDNNYYKLRFLDFYNNLGEKGYPKFEFIQIQ